MVLIDGERIDGSKLNVLLKEHFDADGSLSEFAKRHDLNYFQIYYFCRKNKIATPGLSSNGKSKTSIKSYKSRRKLSEDDESQIVEKYENGFSRKELADLFDISEGGIYCILKRRGAKIKNKNGSYNKKQPLLDKAVLIDLYVNKKLSTGDIIKIYPEYKCADRVCWDLEFYEIPARSYSEAGKNAFMNKPDLIDKVTKHWFGPESKSMARDTSIELKFKDWAKTNRIDIIEQFQILPNTHHFDFRISNSNILIEIDGDFWHGTSRARARDERFDAFARLHDFEVFRITETEINDLDFEAFEFIKQFIKLR